MNSAIERYDFEGIPVKDAVIGFPRKDGEYVRFIHYEALQARTEKAESRLRTLRELCGYIEDGTDTTIAICQDDATKDWVLSVGAKNNMTVWSPTFNDMLDIASKYLEKL